MVTLLDIMIGTAPLINTDSDQAFGVPICQANRAANVIFFSREDFSNCAIKDAL